GTGRAQFRDAETLHAGEAETYECGVGGADVQGRVRPACALRRVCRVCLAHGDRGTGGHPVGLGPPASRAAVWADRGERTHVRPHSPGAGVPPRCAVTVFTPTYLT